MTYVEDGDYYLCANLKKLVRVKDRFRTRKSGLRKRGEFTGAMNAGIVLFKKSVISIQKLITQVQKGFLRKNEKSY